MAVTALVLYVISLFLGIVVRTRIQRNRTGDTGVRGFGGARGSAEWWASLLLAVTHVGGVAGPIAALAGMAPIAVLAQPLLRGLGGAIAVAGIILTVASQLAMGDAWRIGVQGAERTNLVTSGPFRVVRNPIFTAVAATSLGIALMVPNLVALAVFAGLVVALELQVRIIEEPYLRRALGAEYRLYAATVGRFLPFLGRLRES